MYELQPRKFEQLVAELFKAKGYDVELTKQTRDGGIDIYACQKSDLGMMLILIQCKRNAPNCGVRLPLPIGSSRIIRLGFLVHNRPIL